MIISRNLLGQFIDLKTVTNATLVKHLNLLGFESKIWRDYQALDQTMLIAQIVEKKMLPSFQKIAFCQAQISKTKKIGVVCGAKNFQVGDKVIYAPVGCQINPKVKLKAKKFGQFISYGMFCSWKDLELEHFEKEKDKEEGIILLPDKAKIGEKAPLRYFFGNDCLFKVVIPWNQKEYHNLFLLARYLVKSLQKQWIFPVHYQDFWQDFIENDWQEQTEKAKISFANLPVLAYGSQSLVQTLDQTYSFPSSLRALLLFHDLIPTGNLLQDLLAYLQLEFPQIQFLVVPSQTRWVWKEREATFLQEEKAVKKETEKSNLVFFYLTTKNSNSSTVFLTFAAHQRFNQLYHYYSGKKMSYHHFIKWPKIKQPITLDLPYCNKVLGTSLDQQKLQAIFDLTDYQLLKKEEHQTVTLLIPNYYKTWSEGEMMREIIRWYDCQNIPFKELRTTLDKVIKRENQFLLKKKAIITYLLHQQLFQVKNFIFWTKSQHKASPLQLANSQKAKYLQTSLLPNLIKKIKQWQKSIFTIDKVFSQKGEQENLAIVWKKTWLTNPFYQEKITFHKPLILQFLFNLCQILKLEKQLLWSEKAATDIPRSSYLEADKNDPFLADCGYEKLYYQKHPIGELGEIVQKLANKNQHYFYLELKLTFLLELGEQKKLQPIYQKEAKANYLFQDFNLLFSQAFLPKIYCQIRTKKVVECNHYHHLFRKIKTLDKTIVKIAVIDHYQKEKITIRIWKKAESEKKEEKKTLFESTKKLLKELKNVKII